MEQNIRERWTQEEKDKLIELVAKGKTDAQIAAALGRTKKSIELKRSTMNIHREPTETGNAEAIADLTERVQNLTELVKDQERELCEYHKAIMNIEVYLNRGPLHRLFNKFRGER